MGVFEVIINLRVEISRNSSLKGQLNKNSSEKNIETPIITTPVSLSSSQARSGISVDKHSSNTNGALERKNPLIHNIMHNTTALDKKEHIRTSKGHNFKGSAKQITSGNVDAKDFILGGELTSGQDSY